MKPAPTEADSIVQYSIAVTPHPVYRTNSKKVFRWNWRPEVWHCDRGPVWQGDCVADGMTAYLRATEEFNRVVDSAHEADVREWEENLSDSDRAALKRERMTDTAIDAAIKANRLAK